MHAHVDNAEGLFIYPLPAARGQINGPSKDAPTTHQLITNRIKTLDSIVTDQQGTAMHQLGAHFGIIAWCAKYDFRGLRCPITNPRRSLQTQSQLTIIAILTPYA